MLAMNGRQVIRLLQANGFAELRVSGSHHIMGKSACKVTVPVHGAADLKIGTPKSIERQSGVKLT